MRYYDLGLKILGVAGIVVIIISLAANFYRPFNKVSDMRDVTVTVTDKAVKNYDDKSKYLIFTKDANGEIQTYEITDSLLYGRFNSSDLYAAIEEGKRYKLKVGGSRNGFMSWYPNIYEYEELTD